MDWLDFALVAGIVGIIACLWRFAITNGRGTLALYYMLGRWLFAWRIIAALCVAFVVSAVPLGTLFWAVWLVVGP